MTLREDAMPCDCREAGRAYERRKDAEWREAFKRERGREPTIEECIKSMPMRAIDYCGDPDCEKCHGSGWVTPDGSPAVMSTFIPPGGYL